MDLTITSLNGIFDGNSFHEGPLSITISDGSIVSIEEGTIDNPSIDGRGMIASLPFADAHTHLIFGGERFFELGLKLEGKSYSEILERGGGIKYSMKQTRQTPDEQLLASTLQKLDVMMGFGCLDVEVKSGYGLNSEHELRLLRVLKQADKQHPVKVHATFGAAHVFPPDVSREKYIEEIINEMLPIVVQEKLATSTDVFCDRGAFTVEETRSILDASLSHNLPVRVHAEELEYTGIAKIAAQEYSALSADHLLLAREDDFKILAQHNTVANFMPLAPLGLFTHKKPQGFDIDNLTIGLGSDFNPNNWAASIQTAIRMAVFSYRIHPRKALEAATLGSYQAITGNKRPLLSEGTSADLILLRAKTPEEFVSKLGQNLVDTVIKSGNIVFRNQCKSV